MIAIEYLKQLPFRIWGAKSLASNSELRRWLKDGAVDINGKRPQPNDEIQFPITRLVFFSHKPRQTTIWREE